MSPHDAREETNSRTLETYFASLFVAEGAEFHDASRPEEPLRGREAANAMLQALMGAPPVAEQEENDTILVVFEVDDGKIKRGYLCHDAAFMSQEFGLVW
jgi:hypothetical protein